MSKILYFDSETSGLPPKGSNYKTDYMRFPRIVQLSWNFNSITQDYIVKPTDFKSKNPYGIPAESTAIHGITTEKAMASGKCISDVLDRFLFCANEADIIVAFNIYFDTSVIKANVLRTYPGNIEMFNKALDKSKRLDIMMRTIKFCGLKNKNGGSKFPKQTELYRILFNEDYNSHNAKDDIIALKRCHEELIKRGIM